MIVRMSDQGHVPGGVTVTDRSVPAAADVLTPEALGFLADLQATFGSRREALLETRRDRQAAIDGGVDLDVDPATEEIRASDWVVPAAPAALADRRVEI